MSLAIQYAMKKKAGMARGGMMCAHGSTACEMCHGGKMAEGGYARKQSENTLREEEKRSGYENQTDNYEPFLAEGGKVQYDGDEDEDMVGRIISNRYPHDAFEDEEEDSGYEEMPEDREKSNARATAEDDRGLNQHGEKEVGAEGMDEDNESEPDRIIGHAVENQDDVEDMVGRIMAQREHHYSEGGRVANDTSPIADFEDNQFDDLVKRDDLEQHYTGANSGDEIGNANLEDLMHDIVERVMRSRAKRDRNPVPA